MGLRAAIWAMCLSSVLAQNFCSDKARIDVVRSDVWDDEYIDFKGKLFPLMKKLMCGDYCKGIPNCSLRLWVEATTVVRFQKHDEGDGETSTCSENIWDPLIDCITDDSKAGGTYYPGFEDDVGYEIAIEKLPDFTPFKDDAQPGEIGEQPTFYISDYEYKDVKQWYMGIFVVGKNNGTCESRSDRHNDYTADVVNPQGPIVDDNPDIDDPNVGWRKYIPDLNKFTLHGDPSGRICGLPTDFEFTNIGNGQFSFTDKGEDGSLTGYCNVLYTGDDSVVTNCEHPSQEDPNSPIVLNTRPLLGCWVPGVDNYCRDYGSS
ncbi:hypothetical protein BGZ63DRAFT_405658 [Mariannaea sp. PMI_226]|nr:hypothetical protein BGZ63DRAFT_405658 [Mariannaea sp. PMI_226]